MSTKRLPAEKRRKQILKSAIRVFARSTYHGATTKAIAEEAGVTEALIYRYFGSKRKLFTDAITATTSKVVDGIEAIVTEHRDNPIAMINLSFSYYTDLLESHEEMAKMIFLVLSELDEEDVREAYLPHQERALRAIGRTIAHWKANNIVTPDIHTPSAAWLYFGSYLILALVKHSLGDVPIDASKALELIRPYMQIELPDQLHDLDNLDPDPPIEATQQPDRSTDDDDTTSAEAPQGQDDQSNLDAS